MHSILGVSKNATLQELKTARNKLALKWHPDKNQHNIKVATAKMQQINKAYDYLVGQSKPLSTPWEAKFTKQTTPPKNSTQRKRCPNGFRKSENGCKKYNDNNTNTRKRCPNGFRKSGDGCRKI